MMPKWMQMIYMYYLTGEINIGGREDLQEVVDFIYKYKVSASVTGDPLAQKKPRRDKRVV